MMARHELGERRLVARRGSLHELRDLDRHHAHHAIEIRPGAGLIHEASEFDDRSTVPSRIRSAGPPHLGHNVVKPRPLGRGFGRASAAGYSTVSVPFMSGWTSQMKP